MQKKKKKQNVERGNMDNKLFGCLGLIVFGAIAILVLKAWGDTASASKHFGGPEIIGSLICLAPLAGVLYLCWWMFSDK